MGMGAESLTYMADVHMVPWYAVAEGGSWGTVIVVFDFLDEALQPF